jgi:integrase
MSLQYSDFTNILPTDIGTRKLDLARPDLLTNAHYSLTNLRDLWYPAPMATGKITKTVVDRMQPGTMIWDSDHREVVKGFGARRQLGDVFYLLRYRVHGKQRFHTIGRHGSPWTPDTARAEARRLLGLLVDGVDPGAKPASGDIGGLIDRYLTPGKWKARAYEAVEGHLRQHAKPLHRRSLIEIDRRTIATLLGEIETASGPVARNRVRASLSAFWNWAIREGLCDVNPVTGTGIATETTRDRVLSPKELSAVWTGLDDGQFADIVQLLILTGQRRDEIGWLRWSEWRDDAIVLPPERTKNGRAHVVPLSPQALTILDRQVRRNREHVFGIGEGGFSGWAAAKASLDRRVRVPDWRLHDLRRTAATGMAELGGLPHIIEAVLNHVSGHKAGVAGIYNRATYAAECREALKRWADYVTEIAAESPRLRLVK